MRGYGSVKKREYVIRFTDGHQEFAKLAPESVRDAIRRPGVISCLPKDYKPTFGRKH